MLIATSKLFALLYSRLYFTTTNMWRQFIISSYTLEGGICYQILQAILTSLNQKDLHCLEVECIFFELYQKGSQPIHVRIDIGLYSRGSKIHNVHNQTRSYSNLIISFSILANEIQLQRLEVWRKMDANSSLSLKN